MNLFRDTVETIRAVSIGGSNWRANHALGSLVAVFVFLIYGGWLFMAENKAFPASLLLGISTSFFLYWRYLLPEAMRHADIVKTLYGNDGTE